MKPYFAKYLPVEGKIRNGDNYLFQGKVYKCDKSIIKDLEQLYGRDLIEYRKVKLFLCSRKLSIGDRYYNVDYNYYKTVLSFRIRF